MINRYQKPTPLTDELVAQNPNPRYEHEEKMIKHARKMEQSVDGLVDIQMLAINALDGNEEIDWREENDELLRKLGEHLEAMHDEVALRRERDEARSAKHVLQHAACLALATDADRGQIDPSLEWSAAMEAVERLKREKNQALKDVAELNERLIDRAQSIVIQAGKIDDAWRQRIRDHFSVRDMEIAHLRSSLEAIRAMTQHGYGDNDVAVSQAALDALSVPFASKR